MAKNCSSLSEVEDNVVPFPGDQARARSSSKKNYGDMSPKQISSGTEKPHSKLNYINALAADLSPIVHRELLQPQSSASARKKRASRPPTDQQIPLDELLDYIQDKSDPALRRLFPKSAAEHKTIKAKTSRKTARTSLDPRLALFRSFLLELGPCPDDSFSVDRINVLNSRYEPGNIRWASPKTQANNRTTNCRITWRGETRTLIQWSEATGISYETLKKRFQRGKRGDHLLSGSSVAKYKIVVSSKSEVSVTSSVNTQDLMALVGPYCDGVCPCPEPAMGQDGWPEGEKANRWESAYRLFIDKSKRVFGQPARLSRAEFYAWITNSRVISAGKNAMERHPVVFLREGLTTAQLSELYSDASKDEDVRTFLLQSPFLQCAKRQMVRENPRVAHNQFQGLRALCRDKPCTEPEDAVLFLGKAPKRD